MAARDLHLQNDPKCKDVDITVGMYNPNADSFPLHQ